MMMSEAPVCTTWKITIPPFSTISVHANSSVKGTLYAGPCAHRTDTRSPVTHSSSTNGDLWGITSGVLQGAYLSVQLEHPYHGNSHKGGGWAGCSCQASAIGSPPNQDFQGDSNPKHQKEWVLEALGLQGLKEWPESEQKQARELLLKWEHLFVHSDLDLGTTALIKPNIEVMDHGHPSKSITNVYLPTCMMM